MVGARLLLPAALGDSELGRCFTLNTCQKQARLDSEHSKSMWVTSKTKMCWHDIFPPNGDHEPHVYKDG